MHLSKDLRVLIVDDDSDLLESMKDLFTLFNFSVITATNGEEAWSTLQKEKVDIVLTDVRMSKMDGFELLKKIKDKDLQTPKVVVSTAFSDHSIEDFCREGADAFFVKPFDASTVRDCLWQSVMSLTERWQVPPKFSTTSSLRAKFDTVGEAANQSLFSIGRLGFFYQGKEDLPQVDEWIEFDIEFSKDNALQNFKGIGKVKWQRTKSKGKALSGVGVEIKFLTPDSIKESIAYINSHVTRASIPDR